MKQQHLSTNMDNNITVKINSKTDARSKNMGTPMIDLSVPSTLICCKNNRKNDSLKSNTDI